MPLPHRCGPIVPGQGGLWQPGTHLAFPTTGSKNPKIALKLAELQTDSQGKVRAQLLGKLPEGPGGAVRS